LQRIGYAMGMAKLMNEIRAAIKASDETPYAIAQGAKVARSQLSRLLSGESGMSVETIERLADYLGFQITIEPKSKTTKRR
jgi:transcriptional regulator with XRE-family HTH domain